MALIEKQISNHTSGLVRIVEVVGFTADDRRKEVIFNYKIKHFVNGGAEIPLSAPKKDWRVTNNYNATIRDENYEPIPNEDYEPEYEILSYKHMSENGDVIFPPEPVYGENIINSEEVNLTMPAYDYFKSLTFDSESPVSIKTLLAYYIDDNDNKGFFNFY